MSRDVKPLLIKVFKHQIIIIFFTSSKFNVFPKSDWSLSKGSGLIFLLHTHRTLFHNHQPLHRHRLPIRHFQKVRTFGNF